MATSGRVATAELTADLPSGAYNLLALYSGDAFHLAASSSYFMVPSMQIVKQQSTSITAGYSGDYNYAGSTSSALTQDEKGS